MNFFWIFFVFSMLQPLVAQRVLEMQRLGLIRELEKKRGSRVVTLIHRQESMSILGFPLMRYIDINDSEKIIKLIRNTPDEMPLDIILHTPGGLVLAASQIALALKRRKGKVTVFVPYYAMSGGTFIALAADEIIMGEHAVLGPIDPQLEGCAAPSILAVMKRKEINDIDDKTIILADMADKAIRQVHQLAVVLLSEHLDGAKADEIARTLVSGQWTHDYPISYENAEHMGLLVTAQVPEEVYDLMNLFPQPAQKQSTVEYFPLPLKKRSSAAL
ncbi:MAG: hypothetical protein NC924_03285 [Candidatus Omnitrophica bacterium]|nr:hypothetical protein [Candidatus Omnitrophota bacterium]